MSGPINIIEFEAPTLPMLDVVGVTLPLYDTLGILAAVAIPALAGWSWRNQRVSAVLLTAINYFVFSAVYEIGLQEQISGVVLASDARITFDINFRILASTVGAFLAGAAVRLIIRLVAVRPSRADSKMVEAPQ